MKIQLLEHDTFAGDTNIDLWAAARGHALNRTYLDARESLPPLDRVDLLVVTGFTHSVWEEERFPWLVDEKEYLRKALAARKPMLGLCFGAQILAEVMGGEVFKNPVPEIGWYEIALTPEGKQSPLTASLPEKFVSFEWHGDHFTLPHACIRLASTEASSNQAFIGRDHPVVGTQFHPEYTRGLIRYYAREFSHIWPTGPGLQKAGDVLARTAELPETYWLMELLLDRMASMFVTDTSKDEMGGADF
jgi:GMP synthase-like glutamine amidotransferase